MACLIWYAVAGFWWFVRHVHGMQRPAVSAGKGLYLGLCSSTVSLRGDDKPGDEQPGSAS